MDSIFSRLPLNELKHLYAATFPDRPRLPPRIDRTRIQREIIEAMTQRESDLREGEEFVESLMNMEEQPLIQPRRPLRRRDPEFSSEIHQRFKERNKRVEHLRDVYNDIRAPSQDDFYEWLRNKDAPADQAKINKFLESIKFDSVIEFDKLNKNDRQRVFPLMKEKLIQLLGDASMEEKYKVNYRVNGTWRSRTLTPEVYDSLINSLDQQEFIYGNEVFESSYARFSDQPEGELMKLIYFDAISFTRINPSRSTRKDNRSSFFPYLNKSNLNLTRYQIFDTLLNDKGRQREELNDSCFVYALQQAGVEEDVLNKIRLRIHIRKLGLKKMDEICDEFNLHVVVRDLEAMNNHSRFRVNNKTYFGSENGKVIYLNSFKGHFFIDEVTKFTVHYIQHKYVQHEDIPDECYNKRLRDKYWCRTNESKYMCTSGRLIKMLFDANYFEPLTYENSRILSTTLYKNVTLEIQDLHYNEKHCTKLIQPKEKKKKGKLTYYYADFEADVTKSPHTPYICVLQSLKGTGCKVFKGPDCAKQLVDFLSNCYNPCVYFHNLRYDFSFIAEHGVNASMQNGSWLLTASIEHQGTKIEFKDTLPILSCKLSALPSMFNIQGIQKELFPYKYYTIERLEKNIGVIAEAGKDEDRPWTEDDYKIFNENIDKIGCRLYDDCFDMYKYAEFYCRQDVNILRIAFNKFSEDFQKEFGINPFDFISISSLANEVFKQRVYYPNGNLFELGGHVREFVAGAVYGGRCMTAYNKKWINDSSKSGHVISDYDAVSLYPSAMSRLYTVEGLPEVIEYHGEGLTSIPKELEKYSAYIVDIKITHVGKHYPFPLIVKRTDDGNLNDDNIDEEHPYTMRLDNIYLEDLVNFQHITFDVIRGYGWTGKKDYRIQEEIKKIFNKRLEYKKENNPLQQLYKLIMNSCYGKCIEKPHMKKVQYVKDIDIKNKRQTYNQYRRYLEKHYEEIIEDIDMGHGIHKITRLKPIDSHYNNSLLGIQILSMSKRIMNEVMCLASDIGCHIFYQDTDSMHIYQDDLEKLERAYYEKYHRELKGKQLCQFHSDFPEVNGGNKGEIPVAKQSIFLMKKLYLDVLTDSSGKVDYMTRAKGITQAAIKAVAERCGGYIELYKKIYDGESIAFDNAEGAPSFKFSKDFTVSSNEHFIRVVKTTYEEGLTCTSEPTH